MRKPTQPSAAHPGTRVFLAIVLLTLSGLVAACGRFYGEDADRADGQTNDTPADRARVAVQTPVIRDAVQTRRVHGDLIAERQVTVYASMPRRIISFPVRLGDPVEKDEVIAVIDYSQLDFALRQARSGLTAAREQAENLTTELDRAERLYRERGTSKQQYDAIRTQKRTADEAVIQAEARLEQALDQRRDAEVRAPFSGVIGRRHLEVGDMAGPGVPVAVVVDLTPLIARVKIPERDLGHLTRDQPGTVQVAAFGEERFSGRVHRISPVIDPMTRMAEVELLLPNEDERLRPGMFATVEIETDRQEDAVMLPSDVIMQESRIDETDLSGRVQRVHYVYVIEDDTAHRVPVELGYTTGDLIEITAGLNRTDHVVIRGQHLLRDGQSVVVTDMSEEYNR